MSLEKILLPTNNSTWGVHARPIATNLYKFAYDFDNLNDKEEFVALELFNLPNTKLSDLFAKQPLVRWTRKSDIKAEVKIDRRDYDPNYDDDWFLNKDILILQNSENVSIKWFFYAITNPKKLNDFVFSYDCELDVFFTYAHINYINPNAYIRVEQSHFNNWVADSFGQGTYVPSISFSSQNELFSKETLAIKTDNLIKIKSYNLTDNKNTDLIINFDPKTMNDPKLQERFWKTMQLAYWRVVYFSEDVGTRKVWGAQENETSKWNSPWSGGSTIDLAPFSSKLNYYLLATPQHVFYSDVTDPQNDIVNFQLLYRTGTGTATQNVNSGFYNYVNLLLSTNYQSVALAKQSGVLSQAIIHNASYDLPILHFLLYLQNKNINVTIFAKKTMFDTYIFTFQMDYLKYIGQVKNDWLGLANAPSFIIFANNIIGWDINGQGYLPTSTNLKLNNVQVNDICGILNTDKTQPFMFKNEPKMLVSPFTSFKIENYYSEYEFFLNNFNYDTYPSLNFKFFIINDWQISNKGYYIINADNLSLKLTTKMNYYNGAQNYLPTYNNAYTSWAVDNYNQYTTSINQAETRKKEAEANSGIGFLGAIGDAVSGNFGGAVNSINSGVQGAINANFEVQKLQASLADKKNAPTQIQPTTSKEYNNMILNNFSEQLNIYTLNEWNFKKVNWYFHKFGIKSGFTYKWDRENLQRTMWWWDYIETENFYEAVTTKYINANPLSNNIKQIISESYENGITFFHVRRDPTTNKLEYLQIKDYNHNNVPTSIVKQKAKR